MAQSNPVPMGPSFVRQTLLRLDQVSVVEDVSGWRSIDPERVKELAEAFQRGEFGMTVTCDVQVMDAESADNQKLVDDGVSTICALRQCQELWQQNKTTTPEGHPWSPNLVEVFSLGLAVKVCEVPRQRR